MARCSKWLSKDDRCPKDALPENMYCQDHFSEIISVQNERGQQQQQQQQQQQEQQQPQQ